MIRCVAPVDDRETLCDQPAMVERTVCGLIVALCRRHAQELDEEDEDGQTRSTARTAR
jgi:hypothetical protein